MSNLWNSKQTFNYTALMQASFNGDIQIVLSLLEHEGIDVNITNIINL